MIAHVKPNSIIVTSHILHPYIKNISGYTEIINIKTLMTSDPAEHQKSLKNIGKTNINLTSRFSYRRILNISYLQKQFGLQPLKPANKFKT